MNLESQYLDKLTGGPVQFANCWKPDAWWANPTADENLLYLYHDLFGKRRTPAWVERWLGSADFVKAVRKHIPTKNAETTKIVVIDASLLPETSAYTQMVFDGLFPDADYYVWNTELMRLLPIWRSAEVTPITEAAKPSPAEVLHWPLKQLPTRLGSHVMLSVEAFVRGESGVDAAPHVHNLAVLSRPQLQDEGKFTDNVVSAYEEALCAHGLKLGMSDAEIEAAQTGQPFFIIREAMTPAAHSEQVTRAEFERAVG